MGMYSEDYALFELEREQERETLTRELKQRLDKRVWRCRDGRDILVEEMTDNHLENTFKMLLRSPKDFPYKKEYLRIFENEITTRLVLGWSKEYE